MSDDKVLFVGRHLLDRQIVARNDEHVGKVDDVELSDGGDGGAPVLGALLTGQIAYGRRIGGRLGTWIETMAQRLRGNGDPEPRRIDASLLLDIDHSVELNVTTQEVPAGALEHWLRDHFIGRIPGSGP